MQQNKSKEVFNTIKIITKGIDRSPTSSSIRSSSGELLSNPDEVKQRWFEYGKALYNHQPTIDSSCLSAPTFGPNHCSEPAILSRSEIVAAVKNWKQGKPHELMRFQENSLSMVVIASLTNYTSAMIYGWRKPFQMIGQNPLFSPCLRKVTSLSVRTTGLSAWSTTQAKYF